MSNMQGNVGSIGHSQLGSLFPMPWRLLVAVLASVKGEPCDGAVKSFEPISNDRRASDFEGSTTRKGCSGTILIHFAGAQCDSKATVTIVTPCPCPILNENREPLPGPAANVGTWRARA